MDTNLFTENIKISSYPKIILVCGPARSGTTALSHVFIRAGVESHMQPIKSMIRAHHHGEKIYPWLIDGGGERTILSKETIGANEEYEFFNPIRIMMDRGYPKDRILPILIVREPHQNLASWHDLWRGVDSQNFILACRKTMEIAEFCNFQGIPFVSFVHDVIKTKPVNDVVADLFERCGILADPRDVTNWISAPKFCPGAVGNPHVFFYDRPPDKFIREVSDRGGYVYKGREVPEGVKKFITEHGELIDIFSTFCRWGNKDASVCPEHRSRSLADLFSCDTGNL